MSNIPIYRAKKIDSDEYVIGQYLVYKGYATIFNEYGLEGVTVDEITLEISDGHKFRKLSECNFRTDYEMDMHSYNGYVNGWNNALKENGKPPYKVYEMIKSNK